MVWMRGADEFLTGSEGGKMDYFDVPEAVEHV